MQASSQSAFHLSIALRFALSVPCRGIQTWEEYTSRFQSAMTSGSTPESRTRNSVFFLDPSTGFVCPHHFFDPSPRGFCPSETNVFLQRFARVPLSGTCRSSQTCMGTMTNRCPSLAGGVPGCLSNPHRFSFFCPVRFFSGQAGPFLL